MSSKDRKQHMGDVYRYTVSVILFFKRKGIKNDVFLDSTYDDIG